MYYMVSLQSDPDNGFLLAQSGFNSPQPSKMGERTVTADLPRNYPKEIMIK